MGHLPLRPPLIMCDDEEEDRGFILAIVLECPECGNAVLAKLDSEEITGCADHGG